MRTESQLETAMDQMHDAILAADFARIGALSTALESALTELDRPVDAAMMVRLRHKADRNAACAKAAARGIRAAIRRVAEVRQNASGLVTYTEKGTRLERQNATELSRRF